MFNPVSVPHLSVVPPDVRENEPDRLAELLECLADLVVETHARRQALTRLTAEAEAQVGASVAAGSASAEVVERARHSLAGLEELEHHLRSVSVEAASVHQQLLREHLL